MGALHRCHDALFCSHARVAIKSAIGLLWRPYGSAHTIPRAHSFWSLFIFFPAAIIPLGLFFQQPLNLLRRDVR